MTGGATGWKHGDGEDGDDEDVVEDNFYLSIMKSHSVFTLYSLLPPFILLHLLKSLLLNSPLQSTSKSKFAKSPKSSPQTSTRSPHTQRMTSD